MKHLSILGVMAATGLMSSPVLAGFVNGGFEANNFSGWSYRWGKTAGEGTVGKWDPNNPGVWQNDVTWSGHRNWPGAANDTSTSIFLKAMVVNATTGANPYMPSYATPPNGNYQLMLNYKPGTGDVEGQGDNDVTEFEQKSLIGPSDVSNDGKFYVFARWAAIVENPGHSNADEPGFVVMLGVKHAAPGSTWTYTQEFHSGDQQTQNGWVPTLTTRDGTPMFAKQSYFMKQVAQGDSVVIDIATIDCAYGGHGTFAYLDYVGTVVDTTTGPKNDTLGKPCIFGTDSVYVGSRVKLHGDVGSLHGVNLDADANDTGNVWTMDRLWMRDRSKIIGDATYKVGLVKLYNGTSITGKQTLDPALVIKPIATKAVTPGTADQGPVYVGNTLTIPPGNYRNVTSWGGSIKLSSGVYNFQSFTMTKSNTSKLILDNTNGPIDIRINSSFDKQDVKDSVVVSATNDYISKAVSFYSTGDLHIMSGVNKAWGNYDAPNGTMTLDSRYIAGYAHAKKIVVNSDANSTCREAPPASF